MLNLVQELPDSSNYLVNSSLACSHLRLPYLADTGMLNFEHDSVAQKPKGSGESNSVKAINTKQEGLEHSSLKYNIY